MGSAYTGPLPEVDETFAFKAKKFTSVMKRLFTKRSAL